MAGEGFWRMLTIISRGVEISIAGGVEEMVRGLSKSAFFFSFFFCLNHLIFVLSTEAEGRSVKAQNMHAAEAMATKNSSDPPLADLRKKPSFQVPLVWNQPYH